MEFVGVVQMPTVFGMELVIGGVGFLLGPFAGGKLIVLIEFAYKTKYQNYVHVDLMSTRK